MVKVPLVVKEESLPCGKKVFDCDALGEGRGVYGVRQCVSRASGIGHMVASQWS